MEAEPLEGAELAAELAGAAAAWLGLPAAGAGIALLLELVLAAAGPLTVSEEEGRGGSAAVRASGSLRRRVTHRDTASVCSCMVLIRTQDCSVPSSSRWLTRSCRPKQCPADSNLHSSTAVGEALYTYQTAVHS